MTLTTKQSALDVLVDPEWLEAHLDTAAVRVVEVDVSPTPYNEGHIRNAVLWNIYRDLKDADYRLVGRAQIQALIEQSGIEPDSTVVFYGYAPALGLWLLELLGHHDARILNCNRDAWKRAGRPWTDAPAVVDPTSYPVGTSSAPIRADRRAVEAAVNDAACTIIDVRSAAEYQGQRFWPSGAMEPGGRAGHIPGAVHLSLDGILDDDGAFRDAAELGALFLPVGPDDNGAVVTYCTIGARAATAWFVLAHVLGRTNVRVYDGSWAEWGRASDTPID